MINAMKNIVRPKFLFLYRFDFREDLPTDWLTPLRGAGRQQRGGRDTLSIIAHFWKIALARELQSRCPQESVLESVLSRL
jgi:hypothetical protein